MLGVRYYTSSRYAGDLDFPIFVLQEKRKEARYGIPEADSPLLSMASLRKIGSPEGCNPVHFYLEELSEMSLV